MTRRYIALPRAAVERPGFLERIFSGNSPGILISIRTPGDDGPHISTSGAVFSTLALSFDDLSFDPEDDAEVREISKVLGRMPCLFSASHAERILSFLEANQECGTVAIHCDAGISRSPAVAAALSKAEGGDDSRFFKEGVPNMTVYRTLLSSAFEKQEKLASSGETFLSSVPSHVSPSFGEYVRLSDIPNPFRSEFAGSSAGIPSPLVPGEGWCAYRKDFESWTRRRFSLSWRGGDFRNIGDTEAGRNPAEMFFGFDGGESPFGAFGDARSAEV